MGLGCRMYLWLQGHGYEPEPVLPGSQRTFDMGHLVEAAMFREVPLISVKDDGTLDEVRVGPWWATAGELRDNKTGKSIVASMDQLSGFQRVVEFAGYKGHIDGLLKLDTGLYVPDVKSTQGFGYDRHLMSDLMADPFARKYVGQLNGYMQALMDEGQDIAGGVLIFYNKENSQIMLRFVDHDPAVVAEIRERLSWATNPAEPEPDYPWIKADKIPLPCGYCSQRNNCSAVRGQGLTQLFDKKGKPVWLVA